MAGVGEGACLQGGVKGFLKGSEAGCLGELQ